MAMESSFTMMGKVMLNSQGLVERKKIVNNRILIFVMVDSSNEHKGKRVKIKGKLNKGEKEIF